MKLSFNALLVIAALIVGGGYYVNSKFESNSDDAELEEWADEIGETTIYKADLRIFSDEIEEQKVKQILIRTNDDDTLTYEQFLSISEIMYCEFNSKDKKVDIYIDNYNEPLKVSSTLKAISEKIGNQDFIYELKKYIINFNYVSKVVTNNTLDANNKDRHKAVIGKTKISINKNLKPSFMKKLEAYRKYAEPIK